MLVQWSTTLVNHWNPILVVLTTGPLIFSKYCRRPMEMILVLDAALIIRGLFKPVVVAVVAGCDDDGISLVPRPPAGSVVIKWDKSMVGFCVTEAGSVRRPNADNGDDFNLGDLVAEEEDVDTLEVDVVWSLQPLDDSGRSRFVFVVVVVGMRSVDTSSSHGSNTDGARANVLPFFVLERSISSSYCSYSTSSS